MMVCELDLQLAREASQTALTLTAEQKALPLRGCKARVGWVVWGFGGCLGVRCLVSGGRLWRLLQGVIGVVGLLGVWRLAALHANKKQRRTPQRSHKANGAARSSAAAPAVRFALGCGGCRPPTPPPRLCQQSNNAPPSAATKQPWHWQLFGHPSSVVSTLRKASPPKGRLSRERGLVALEAV